MGGDITVTSAVNEGSTFTCTVAVEICDKPAPDQPKSQRVATGIKGSQTEYRILVTDDNVENRNLLSQILTPAGFSLEMAETGEECIETFESWHPHLVLLDLSLPKMSGEEALTAMKSSPRGEETRIVIVTANAFDYQRDAFVEKGADGYLVKPFRSGEILAEIAKQLNIEYEYSDSEVTH